ncbi:MAG TPA: metallophosphoesterase family protein [Dongiaceae bacterium]|nr:metallophosphoesterase family protein [Dongiaceae bacterium]
MRLLILSDLHANLTALDAALAAASGRWDAAVCLGDIVGYGPDPVAVSEKLRGITSDVIRGNHDKAVAGVMSSDDFNPVAKLAVEWTQGQLSPELMVWLAELPAGPRTAQGVVLIHGAFQDEDEYVFTPSQALEGLLDSSTILSFFGHTHHQGGFSYHHSDIEVLQVRPRAIENFFALHLEPDHKYLLNPGSIGQPRDGDPRAAFAIADIEHKVVEFWRVPYDIPAVQTRMADASLPDALIHRLALGR